MDIKKQKALGIKITSDWGHFRKVDSTSIKETYKFPPRTTVAGLLAAIVGKPRDSYYDTFLPDTSAIALSVNEKPVVNRYPVLELSTDPNSLRSIKGMPVNKIVSRKSTSEERQRNIYEVLTNPSYTVWVALNDNEFYDRLRSHLSSGTSYYTPTMGKSEYIADIEYLGEFDILESDTKSVDTLAPINEVKMEQDISVERVPAYNTKNDDGRGRELGGAITLAYESSGEATKVETDETYMIKKEDNSSYVRFI